MMDGARTIREVDLTSEERADLLRQAADPTTPGADLLQLLAHQLPSLKPIVVANPALPVDVIARLLRAPITPGNATVLFALCFNPSVPLALMTYPAPEQKESARRLLASLSPKRYPETSLGSLVSGCELEAFRVSEMIAPDPAEVQAVALARILAGLFGLPWTEDR